MQPQLLFESTLERVRNGNLETDGRLEDWKIGRVEEWKSGSGRLEEWKSGRADVIYVK